MKNTTELSHPILKGDLKDFSRWVVYGGFQRQHQSGRVDETHLGHDFISYLDTRGVEHFNLPVATPVRAVADGLVQAVLRGPETSTLRDYELLLVLQHQGFVSGYAHVVPQVSVGDRVRRGQVIATLYDSSQQYPTITLPTNLHLELGSAAGLNDKYPFFDSYVDPLEVLAGLREMSVESWPPYEQLRKEAKR